MELHQLMMLICVIGGLASVALSIVRRDLTCILLSATVVILAVADLL